MNEREVSMTMAGEGGEKMYANVGNDENGSGRKEEILEGGEMVDRASVKAIACDG